MHLRREKAGSSSVLELSVTSQNDTSSFGNTMFDVHSQSPFFKDLPISASARKGCEMASHKPRMHFSCKDIDMAPDINIHTYIHTHTHTQIHTYIHPYIPTYLPTYIPTYLPTYRHTCLHIYIHTFIHTHLHTYIPTYIHTHTYRNSG